MDLRVCYEKHQFFFKLKIFINIFSKSQFVHVPLKYNIDFFNVAYIICLHKMSFPAIGLFITTVYLLPGSIMLLSLLIT